VSATPKTPKQLFDEIEPNSIPVLKLDAGMLLHRIQSAAPYGRMYGGIAVASGNNRRYAPKGLDAASFSDRLGSCVPEARVVSPIYDSNSGFTWIRRDLATLTVLECEIQREIKLLDISKMRTLGLISESIEYCQADGYIDQVHPFVHEAHRRLVVTSKVDGFSGGCRLGSQSRGVNITIYETAIASGALVVLKSRSADGDIEILDAIDEFTKLGL
jgi:hypothetical protein